MVAGVVDEDCISGCSFLRIIVRAKTETSTVVHVAEDSDTKLRRSDAKTRVQSAGTWNCAPYYE
jgi:hypothetical protein